MLKIPTECKLIDKILEGGIPSESLSLFYGEAETGKSTLALQCAISCAEHGHKTLYVDCDGTFSPVRLVQMAVGNFAQISEMIILMKPSDFGEQALVVDHLEDYITENFGLIVIDTVTSLYRAKIAESPSKTFELNRELNKQLALLAQIAKTKKIAVLMVSQVRSAFNNAHISIEPVATRVVKFWAETIIMMKPTENSSIINAIVEKMPKKTKIVQPLTCHLKIGKSGIQDHLTR